MIYSNIPTMLAQQDFYNKHKDMIDAARNGVADLVYDPMFDEMVTKEEYKIRQEKYKSWAMGWDLAKSNSDETHIWFRNWENEAEPKIGSVLRIRLPKDFKVTDGPKL